MTGQLEGTLCWCKQAQGKFHAVFPLCPLCSAPFSSQWQLCPGQSLTFMWKSVVFLDFLIIWEWWDHVLRMTISVCGEQGHGICIQYPLTLPGIFLPCLSVSTKYTRSLKDSEMSKAWYVLWEKGFVKKKVLTMLIAAHQILDIRKLAGFLFPLFSTHERKMYRKQNFSPAAGWITYFCKAQCKQGLSHWMPLSVSLWYPDNTGRKELTAVTETWGKALSEWHHFMSSALSLPKLQSYEGSRLTHILIF